MELVGYEDEEAGRSLRLLSWEVHWALGYSKRFGIVYIDFETQQRIVKDSGYWYKELVSTRELKLPANYKE